MSTVKGPFLRLILTVAHIPYVPVYPLHPQPLTFKRDPWRRGDVLDWPAGRSPLSKLLALASAVLFGRGGENRPHMDICASLGGVRWVGMLQHDCVRSFPR